MATFTKDAIKKTFIRLLDEKPLSQITVKMLVEECGINRNSFYYHYQDLPALIEEIIQEEADRIIRTYPTVETVEDALLAAVDFASSNRRAILHIYHSINRDIFERYLWSVCDSVLLSYEKAVFAESSVPQSDRELIRHFYRCACFGIVIDWLNQHMEPDIHKQISRLCELHRGLPEEMIRRSEN